VQSETAAANGGADCLLGGQNLNRFVKR
jgi:hypothetical protein